MLFKANICRSLRSLLASVALVSTSLSSTPSAAADKQAPLVIAKQGVFFVGGKYRSVGKDRFMEGQMYVQFQIPAHQTKPYPIILIHGQGQSGVNFLSTPDGREGWADLLLRQGYAVYVVDQPMRGRSTYNADFDGPLGSSSVSRVEGQFTRSQPRGEWAVGITHSQWPGSGEEGDPAFDQFYASQLASTDTDAERMDSLARDAGVALLDRIGPAILLTHSRAGPFGWLIADARPKLVKAIVAVEPSGPPFGNDRGPPFPRPWGITTAPMTYSPKAATAADLAPVQEKAPQAPGLARCWKLTDPRSLPELNSVPVAVVTGEASYHHPSDHCTVQFLQAAGVKVTPLNLENLGIRGNGHMMMLEKNNAQILGVISSWLAHVNK